MARIRTIKPEFYTNEKLSEQPEVVHFAAGGLLTYADDFGYFNANPGLIKAALFPLREPSVKIPEILRRLQALGYLALGKGSDGRSYGRVVRFEDHQRVSHPTDSKIKELVTEWEVSGEIPEASRASVSGTGNREQGTGKGKEQGGGWRKSFEDFWKAYPRKEAKDRAEDWWKREKPNLETLTAMLLAIEWQKRAGCLQEKNTPDGRSVIPHPASWLNAGRWKDDKPAEASEASFFGATA